MDAARSRLLWVLLLLMLLVFLSPYRQKAQSHAAVRPADAPTCGTDGWVTYGHDAGRTFASTGCVRGPLTLNWLYQPPAPTLINGPNPTVPCTWTVSQLFNALATTDAAYLQFSAHGTCQPAGYASTAADKINAADGSHVWTFNWDTDANEGYWGTLAGTQVILQNDSIHGIDSTTGTPLWGNHIDRWGQTLPDTSSVYAVNTLHVDGPGISLRSYALTSTNTVSGTVLWQQNGVNLCTGDASDTNGALAMDNGTIFFAPDYQFTVTPIPLKTGIYAFNSATGRKKWSVATTPSSAMSTANGHLYLIENSTTLVARNQSDGSVAWTQPLNSPGAQAPVLAAGMVIVATAGGILSFDQTSGMPDWTAPITGAATAKQFNGTVPNTTCGSGTVDDISNISTTMAAALGTGTLVVTAGSTIYVLALDTGSELWSGTLAQAVGNVHDPIIVGSSVYVLDSGLDLFALEATSSPVVTPTSTAIAPTDTPTSTALAPTATPTATATATPTMTPLSPTVVSSPTSGSFKQTVTITGTNFGANEPVNVYWDSTSASPLASTTTSASGAFVAKFSVPQAISGTHTIVVPDQASAISATAPFLVKPRLALAPASGTAGVTTVVATGYGFGTTEPVTAHWATPMGAVLGNQTTTNSLGTFTGANAITFTVPLSSTGTYAVHAVSPSSKASSKFTVS
jgi:hypothetical protein